MRRRRLDDRPRPERDGADPQAEHERAEQERERAEAPPGRDPPRPDSGALRLRRLGEHVYDRFAAFATSRTKSTIRGPHREAMSSSTLITRWCFTAETFAQPGRAPTVLAVWPQHFVSARTTMSGLALTMYSTESCG